MRDIAVTTPSGRRLAVAAMGDPHGVPVVFHHGTPGNLRTHNQAPHVLAGSRAIFYDRPGYGGSDRQPGRSVADCAADVAAIADHFGIDRFAVAGSSGGGPHALACAAILGERVTRLAVVAGFAPTDVADFDALAGMSEGNVAEFEAAFAGEEALGRHLAEFVEATAGNPETIIDEIVAELPEPDRRALARPDIRALFVDAIGGAISGDRGGWIDDDLAFAQPWGFELGTIEQEALLLQGEHDLLVPRSHMNYIATKLPRGELNVVPGGGHTLFDEMTDVVRWLVGSERAPSNIK